MLQPYSHHSLWRKNVKEFWRSIDKKLFYENIKEPNSNWGWSGRAMVLDKLPGPWRPTIWMTVGQGPTALAVGAGGGCLDIFTLLYLFSSITLWETARYRLKYCLKGPFNPKQPTNQPNSCSGPCGEN